MLPSGIIPSDSQLRAIRSADGIYVVRDAYKGRYDFFAPSPLFRSAQQPTVASSRLIETRFHPRQLLGRIIVMKFIWEWCEVCDKAFVRCPKCGNNCCNGGYGAINGVLCDVCPQAYEIQRVEYNHDRVPSKALINWNGGVEAA